jgi:hypothetical protein
MFTQEPTISKTQRILWPVGAHIVMDTHSVDLSMNLAELATLTMNTGKTVQAKKWDAPLGGHHAEGILSFPAMVDETLVLEEVSTITLTLVNLDAPERIFVWRR